MLVFKSLHDHRGHHHNTDWTDGSGTSQIRVSSDLVSTGFASLEMAQLPRTLVAPFVM